MLRKIRLGFWLSVRVVAHTDCILLSLDKKDFQFCFGTSKTDGNNRMTLFGRIDNLRKVRLGDHVKTMEQ